MAESMRLALGHLNKLLGDADFERLVPLEIRELYTDELGTQNMDDQVDSPFSRTESTKRCGCGQKEIPERRRQGSRGDAP